MEDSNAALDLANRKPNVCCENYSVQEESMFSVYSKYAVCGDLLDM